MTSTSKNDGNLRAEQGQGNMLTVDIPGCGRLEIAHLVLDLNGTLAVDGVVPDTVLERLQTLSRAVEVHVITADTFGTVERLHGLDVSVQVLEPGDQVEAKAALVRTLGAAHTMSIGNGANDEGMVREAAVGIAIIGREGAHARTVLAADVVVGRIEDAFDLLLTPKRLIATLRTR
jgi:soluble P-type ATPase